MKDISFELIARVQEQDQAAFEELYRACSSFVYTVTLRITGNEQDAQEATQDIFLKVYHSIKGFEFRSSFKTWLYRIAVNSAISKYRAMKRHISVSPEEEIDIPQEATQGEALDAQERKVYFEKLIEKLNPNQKACLLLREVEGFSYEDIARTLKIPINTVRSRLARARVALLNLGNVTKG
jgi:RNA polymerase sigma-70 factor, ECF subfamily